jgi:hypothetical protein
MALALVAAALAHVHGWFALSEVEHILARPRPRLTIAYGDLSALRGSAATAPRHVALAAADDGTHGFVHDGERIRRCLWAGDLTLAEKVVVATQMLAWLRRQRKPVAHRVFAYEDGFVLTLAALALECDE